MSEIATTISQDLVAILQRQGLEQYLPEIAEQLTKASARVQEVTIVSAIPLTEEERTKLSAWATERWGEQQTPGQPFGGYNEGSRGTSRLDER